MTPRPPFLQPLPLLPLQRPPSSGSHRPPLASSLPVVPYPSFRSLVTLRSSSPRVTQCPQACSVWPSCGKPTQSFRNLSLPAILNPGSPCGNPHCRTCLKNRMIFPHGQLGDRSSSQHSHWQKDTLPGVLWCP